MWNSYLYRNCGSPVEGAFCAKCGTPMAAGAAPSPAAQYGGQAAQSTPAPQAQAGGLTDNVASAIAYFLGFITGIIFLVLAPYNQSKTVRFHAFQSIFMSIGVFIAGIALSIISTIFFAISFWLGSLFGLIHLLFGLGVFILWLFMMFKAYQGQKVMLPIIGALAEKQA